MTESKAKIWWPLLDLNQRPSDYESQFNVSKISKLMIYLFSLSQIMVKSSV